MKFIITEGQYDRLILRGQDDGKLYGFIEPYLESEAVTVKVVGNYIVIDVQSPGYFHEFGFDKGMGNQIKAKLRKNGYMSTGVGEYVKKIDKSSI